jgi:hypothetical protein
MGYILTSVVEPEDGLMNADILACGTGSRK